MQHRITRVFELQQQQTIHRLAYYGVEIDFELGRFQIRTTIATSKITAAIAMMAPTAIPVLVSALVPPEPDELVPAAEVLLAFVPL
jgi:hypothetical protein